MINSKQPNRNANDFSIQAFIRWLIKSCKRNPIVAIICLALIMSGYHVALDAKETFTLAATTALALMLFSITILYFIHDVAMKNKSHQAPKAHQANLRENAKNQAWCQTSLIFH